MNDGRRGITLPLVATCCAIAACAPGRVRADGASDSDEARAYSAHADRVVLVPTAQTQPRGTVFLSDYEIVMPSVGYAFTDDVQAAS